MRENWKERINGIIGTLAQLLILLMVIYGEFPKIIDQIIVLGVGIQLGMFIYIGIKSQLEQNYRRKKLQELFIWLSKKEYTAEEIEEKINEMFDEKFKELK